jgi:hypothetical protein
MSTVPFAPGNYRYIPSVFQYSGGAAADPGYSIERVSFRTPIPLAEGFSRVEQIIQERNRPLTSFCACELRSPAPFSESGFRAFNEIYVGTLARWGIYDPGMRMNPVARSNVCPEIDPPGEPSFHAFCFTVPANGASGSFVISGSGEAPEGKGQYGDFIVARGDTSAAGMRAKGRAVLGEMERRMGLLGFAWADTSVVQVYTVYDLHPFIGDEIVGRGAARNGITWHYARPPVVELDYEMDCRAVDVERVV